MEWVLAFAIVLMVSVLLSDLAGRTILSSSVMFLVAGIVVASLGYLHLDPQGGRFRGLLELALVTTLFTDGMKIGLHDLRRSWRLPGRALLVGLPLTLAINTLIAHWIGGFGWAASWLIGAVLSPTDPVFAAAIVGDRNIPGRLRELLNVESGLNDGLTLPILLFLLMRFGALNGSVRMAGEEVVAGVAIGLLIPWLAIRIESASVFSMAPRFRPQFPFAIMLLVFSLSSIFHANEYLGSFVAGSTLASLSPTDKEAFHPFGEQLTELLKLAALLVFGSLLPLTVLMRVPWSAFAAGLLILFAARPLAIGVALLRSSLPWPERLVAMWFGPKGFASVIFALLVANSYRGPGHEVARFAAVVIALSMVLHSSTDVLVSHWLKSRRNSDASDTMDSMS